MVGLFLLVRGPRVIGALLVCSVCCHWCACRRTPARAGSEPPHGVGLVLTVISVAGWVWHYLPPALLAAAYFPKGQIGRPWRAPAG